MRLDDGSVLIRPRIRLILVPVVELDKSFLLTCFLAPDHELHLGQNSRTPSIRVAQ